MTKTLQISQLAPSTLASPRPGGQRTVSGNRSRWFGRCGAGVTLAVGLAWAGAATAQDFSGQDLTGTTFSNVDFSGADFSDANLTDVLFSGTILVGADFSAATLTRMVMLSADARGANFQFSTGTSPQFISVDLRGANFGAVDWNQARIQDASDCSQASFVSATLRNFIMRNGVVCNSANFTQTDFVLGPRFLNSEIQSSLFLNATMPSCQAINSSLNGTSFAGADFAGCDFSGSDMTDVTF
jgi:uncharacterized protein YjbI with pentapeptide repeats